MGDKVRVFEVGPRDGLQNESIILPAETRLELVRRLTKSGLKNIEIGSFVHPKWVPQMSDTDAVARELEHTGDVAYWALVPNAKGLSRAIECGVKHVAVFMSSSETHNQRNVNRSIAESLAGLSDVIGAATTEGCTVRAYISTVFGCPYEGDVDFDRVLEIGDTLLEYGAFQISLGDTTGMGQPLQVRENARRAVQNWGVDQVALHLHDTQGLGQTNAFAAYLEGIRNFDSSVGGLGGCPYAPGAPGNLGTEDLLNLLHSMGAETGVDAHEIATTSEWLRSSIGFNIKSRITV
jgi:hydroxymethylglutaryl-CoA lyase